LICALPFAYTGMILVAGHGLTLWQFAGTTGAMTSAYTFATAANRLIDRHIEPWNRRAAGRALPEKRVSAGETVFAITASAMTRPPRRVITRRNLLHDDSRPRDYPHILFIHEAVPMGVPFVLGRAIGPAPVGALVRTRGEVDRTPMVLCLAVVVWFVGFDASWAT
jgi:4-hydroxybenzoate polyprenyltransferase